MADGYVYAIGNGRGAVKIGWSNDPWRRLSEVNTHDAGSCALLGATIGTREHEKEAHAILGKYRIRGEWFAMTSKAVMAFVLMLGKDILRRNRPESKSCIVVHPLSDTVSMEHEISLFKLRKHLGWSQKQMASELGLDRSNISRIENGVQQMSGPVRRLAGQVAASAKVDLRQIEENSSDLSGTP